MTYRISKRVAPLRSVHVRFHPSDGRVRVEYAEGELRSAIRKAAHAHAPRLLRTVPLRVHSVLRDGVPHGGPGLAHELMTEQLYIDVVVLND